MIMAWHRSNQTSKRLHYLPGIGPMLATALVASVADPRTFRSGRNFSAWIGLVPKQRSSGGKNRLGSISNQAFISHRADEPGRPCCSKASVRVRFSDSARNPFDCAK
jgi:transposase